jgi:hypothetical protein
MTRGKRNIRGRAASKTATLGSPSQHPTPAAVAATDFSPIFSGPEVKLIDISKAGVKLEGDCRLSTAANVCLRLVTTDRVFLLKGRVLRSRTAAEDPSSGPFESVIAFDEDFLVFSGDEASGYMPKSGDSDLSFGTDYIEGGQPSNPPILAVTASAACSGSEMRKILGFRA